MMQNKMMNSPVETLEENFETQIKRIHMPVGKMILLGVLAGMFIALGAAASSVAMHDIDNVGVARVVGGTIFPIGMLMIVLLGGELFTGDCLLILGIFEKKYKCLAMARVLTTVFLANLVGSVVVALLSYLSGQFGHSNGLLGAYVIKVAYGKATLSFGNAFFSGVLCNIIVCGAVLMAGTAKNVAGKVWAVFFPIFAFVVSGYEHCVANMYYIPAGIFASASETYHQLAMQEYGYTLEQLESLNWKSFIIDNSIPVTLGNMVGGMLLATLLWYARKNSR